MFPFVFHSGSFVIPTFFFMVMVGVLALTFFIYFKAPRLGLSQIVILDLAIVGTIFGVLGARIFHVLFEHLDFYLEDPMRVFEFWRGGFVSFGAYIGGTLAVFAYLKIRKLPPLPYADLVCTGLPFLVFFVRVGCLGAGCCFGIPTDSWFGIVFHNPASDAGSRIPGVHVHPTQIYDMLNAIVIFLVLNWRYPRRRFDGEIMILFFVMYSFFRSLIEIFRGDADRGLYFNDLISTGQITSAIFILLCGVAYYLLNKRSRSSGTSS